MTQPDGADIVAELVDRCPEHGTRTETWADCRCAAARETAALLAKVPTGSGRADDTTLRGRIAKAIDDVTGGTCPTDIVDAVLAVVQPEMERLRKAERAVNLLAGAHREAEEAEAHPPLHQWRVEILDGTQWMPAGALHRDQAKAQGLLDAGNAGRSLWADGTPVQRRLVRETTTYTVEPAS